ncbi:DUF6090 family protein [Muriicola sp. Z0-33]|uniref:DUF6090 family protein n=1 Tax=Muriicola sp. Z0-33 TaxID=2816957 RepID=UPI002237AAEE|nr:DUF6090 family protein [Muriicola sp. Z0-33]MCW5515788.1 hypothetical protein [Muriicola sp. Z0-33]
MKLFRNLRQSLIKEGNLKRYLLYALGEILLVMIGISLAFQVDNWNEDRIKRNAEIQYYENIRVQITDDKELILEMVEFNNDFKAQFSYANTLIETNNRDHMDSLGSIVRNLTQYSDFDRQGNIYETMVNSGQIKLLRNQEIIDRIRTLEEKYLYINRMENIHYDAMISHTITSITPILKFSDASVQRPELLFHYEFQNLLLSLVHIMNEKDKVYHQAIAEIDRINALINDELNTN